MEMTFLYWWFYDGDRFQMLVIVFMYMYGQQHPK